MGDLISRKKLLELYDGLEGKGLRIPIDVLILNIEDQPTAYDIDKVVEQLEDKAFEMWDEDNPYTNPKVIKLNKAIEIVKGGAE